MRTTKRTILSIVGARPQFVKLWALEKHMSIFNHIIIHTGQHYDFNMSEAIFKDLNIPKPHIHLNIGSDKPTLQVSKMISGLDDVIKSYDPDNILVYGDTSSTLAGALTARMNKIPLSHIEAGMRSYNVMPEETSRVVSDHIADYLFCSTSTAMNNLQNEGIYSKSYLVGDLMADALQTMRPLINQNSSLLQKYKVMKNEYLLLTVHREDNTINKEKLSNILHAFSKINYTTIFPAHPRTKKAISDFGLMDIITKAPNIMMIDAVPYSELLTLQNYAKKIITDSGGMQKEAYLLRKPCITLRLETEWVETVEDNANILVGTNKPAIIQAIRQFDIDESASKLRYGEGRAAEKIAKIINSTG